MTTRVFLLVALGMVILAGCGQGNWSSGDRVLVGKFLYDSRLTEPQRFDVVVFKYPVSPVERGTHKNYIKRLLGLPGEIIAIFFGRLFRWHPAEGEPPPFDDHKVLPRDRWDREYMHSNDPLARRWFEEGRFEIVRKPPAVMLAMRRIVYDNDFQAKDLEGVLRPRWSAKQGSGWADQEQHKVFQHVGGKQQAVDWLRYQHLLRNPAGGEPPGKPQLINDYLGYNGIQYQGNNDLPDKIQPPNWVGDLMLECDLTVDKAEGEFWLELSKGVNRYRARFDLATGQCTLFRQGPEGPPMELGSRPTGVKGAGNYRLRLANFDARLTLWVDSELPFGDGQEYPPPEIRSRDEKELPEEKIRQRRGPTENDLQPASVGSFGSAVKVSHLRLWRDTYYTLGRNSHSDADLHKVDWHDKGTWEALANLDFLTMYVQPGHYLCLGDNSPQSSDGRSWGLVPQRLLLGRAQLVYYPFDRAGLIR